MTDKPYDSYDDTMKHIELVRFLLRDVCARLEQRALDHDRSKLQSPEKEVFDAVTPRLRGLTYGSDEYKASLAEMGVALEHHYAHNSHHPEFHGERGVNGMDLLDVVELLCDHLAATRRHADGDIWKSMEINRTRFGYSDQLYEIMSNTIRRMGWG